MEIFNREAPRSHDISHGIVALLGACLLYAIVVFFVFFTIVKRHGGFMSPAGTIPQSLLGDRRGGPAPVRWSGDGGGTRAAPGKASSQKKEVSLPRAPQPKPVPKVVPVPKPVEKPVEPIEQLEQEPAIPVLHAEQPVMPVPQIEQPAVLQKPLPVRETVLPVVEKPVAHEPEQQDEQVEQPPVRPEPTKVLPTRAKSRARWFKSGAETNTTPSSFGQQVPGSDSSYKNANYGTSGMGEGSGGGEGNSEGSSGLSGALGAWDRMNNARAYRNAQSGPGSGRRGDPVADAQRAELELFFRRLGQTLCETSRMQPQSTGNRSIEEHTVVVRIAINRDRRITNVIFIQPSPHAFINAYMEHLFHILTPPQLPRHIKDDVLEWNLRVYINHIPGSSEIYFVQND